MDLYQTNSYIGLIFGTEIDDDWIACMRGGPQKNVTLINVQRWVECSDVYII